MKEKETSQPADVTATVGEFVAEDYRTAQVFEKYGIDFCCGGKVIEQFSYVRIWKDYA